MQKDYQNVNMYRCNKDFFHLIIVYQIYVENVDYVEFVVRTEVFPLMLIPITRTIPRDRENSSGYLGNSMKKYWCKGNSKSARAFESSS